MPNVAPLRLGSAAPLQPVHQQSLATDLAEDESIGDTPRKPPLLPLITTALHSPVVPDIVCPRHHYADERQLLDLCLVARLNEPSLGAGQPQALRYLVAVYTLTCERQRLSSPVRTLGSLAWRQRLALQTAPITGTA
jgi:hypothetical protein